MKKIFILLLLSVFVFACGEKESDTLILGTSNIFPPFTYSTATESNVGFDIEVAKIIARDYGKKLQIVNMEFSQLIPALQKGEIDMAMSSMTITTARGQLVDFSTPYYEASQAVLIQKEHLDEFQSIATKEELGQTKNLAAERDSTGAAAAFAIAGGRYVHEDTFEMVVAELLNRKVDAVIMDKIISMATATQHDVLTIVPTIRFDPEHYGIAVKKGNHKLLASINKTINELVVSGNYKRLEEEYVNKYFD